MTFQAKLTTKLELYSVDDTIIELNNLVKPEELDLIVKNLLKQLDNPHETEAQSKKFDFLVGGRILRTDIEQHLELYSDELDAKEILNEKLVEIEYILSSESPQPLTTLTQKDWVSCVDVNGEYLISGSYDCSINLYSLKQEKSIASLKEAHNKPITGLKWLRREDKTDGRLYFVSTGFDELAIIWAYDEKKRKFEQLITLRGHKRSVDSLDIQDDLIVTGSSDKCIKIWSASPNNDDENELNGESDENKKKRKTRTNDEPKLARDPTLTLTGHKDAVRGVRWLSNGTGSDSLASCSTDGLLLLWDVESGSETRRFVSVKPMLAVDHCKRTNILLTASCDCYARIWDARAPNESRAASVFSSHSGWVSCVAFSHKEYHFVSGGYDNLVKLWDVRSPKACLYDLIGHSDKVLDVNCSNPKYVASGSADSTIRLFTN